MSLGVYKFYGQVNRSSMDTCNLLRRARLLDIQTGSPRLKFGTCVFIAGAWLYVSRKRNFILDVFTDLE